MRAKTLFAALPIAGLLFTPAFAQDPLPDGVPFYVAGDPAPLNFSPGSEPSHEFVETSESGVYEVTISGFTVGETYQYKAASAGFSSVNIPDAGFDNKLFIAESTDVTFVLDTNVKNDGGIPDYDGPNGLGILFNDNVRLMVENATAFELVGSFQEALSGETGVNFTPGGDGSVPLVDDNDDGIFIAEITGIPGGTYQFKAVINESFDVAFSNAGFRQGGPDLSFDVFSTDDTVTITYDSNTDRMFIETESGIELPGESGRFFAFSSGWLAGIDTIEELELDFDGINNLYTRVFTVEEPGDYRLRVREGDDSNEWPNTGEYPFTTTEANQEVLVVFDRNTYTDGAQPASDFVFIIENPADEEDPIVGLNTWDRIQPVGDWQDAFGGANFDTGQVFFEANDDGTNGDLAAGDDVWTLVAEAFQAVDADQVKAVGARAGTSDGGFFIQFGGTDDGVTISGNNSAFPFDFTPGMYTFQVDTITGRMLVTRSTSAPFVPQRSELFGGEPSAADEGWNLYQ